MIEQELILLGLLKESPKHGYEIKKKIKEIFSLFAGVNLKSIYYPLRILEKKKLVTKRITRPGRHPQRLVYTLTPQGEARFKELLNRSLLNFKRPQFSLDLSLYFLNYMKPDIVKNGLRARTRVLRRLSRSLKQMVSVLKKKGSAPSARILEHNLQMVETESKFLASLIKTF
ncbi:MAG: PadR family transcriptional regulator [Candidatus Omnitrophica bacterium]|nr:PadR family transcriptional regulator [Candidatus Omnitrophota bacterium]MDD5592127.1 PadR family transcriptional regulator [Candidatus Omnitrophota bacterium]